MMQRRKEGHKARSGGGGFALVEIAVALSILTVLGLLLLKLSLNIVTPRSWMMHQTLADAFMTSERAAAERIPFEELISDDPEVSPWGRAPVVVENQVLGRLPGLREEPAGPVEGRQVTGRLTRVRVPDGDNPEAGGDEMTNPAAMKIWKVRSSLEYEINGRSYVKTRTVIRMQ